MKSLIKSLVETAGPSGYESAVRDLVKAEVVSLADEWRVDALGNLIVRKGEKKPEGMRVMLSAHLDEIGLIVKHIDENGFIRFTNIGVVRPHTLLGSRVKFLNGVSGVIGGEKLDNAGSVHGLDKLFIDVGATSRDDCPVKVGDILIFDRPLLDLGQRLVAKALDNRVSVAVLIEVLRKLNHSPHEVYFVFTTQEEVGIRGVTTAAYSIDPDLGIAVDVTATGDTPKGLRMEVKLGAGPAVKIRDGGMLSDPRVVRWMTGTAEQAKIPFQLEILETGSTDAKAIQLTRSGVPVGCVSIPCRYIHSPSEMVDFQDVQQAVTLLVELLNKPIKLD